MNDATTTDTFVISVAMLFLTTIALLLIGGLIILLLKAMDSGKEKNTVN